MIVKQHGETIAVSAMVIAPVPRYSREFSESEVRARRDRKARGSYLNLPFTAAHGSIRFGFSGYTTQQDIERITEVFPQVADDVRKLSPYREPGVAPRVWTPPK